MERTIEILKREIATKKNKQEIKEIVKALSNKDTLMDVLDIAEQVYFANERRLTLEDKLASTFFKMGIHGLITSGRFNKIVEDVFGGEDVGEQ